MSTVLGIDLGTQGVKVVFYDFQARETAAVASAPLALDQDATGRAEQHAHWWLDALQKALKQVDKGTRNSALAVGVSGQQHGFVPLDKDGQVLTPVKLWCDTSTSAECDAIMDALGGVEACLAEAGNAILPGYTASKVRWLRDRHPDLYAAMDCILLPHDYLNFHLCGERCMEAGDASGTGFLDIRSRRWSERMLAAVDPDRDLRECLPDVRIEPGQIGTLLPRVADELGLPGGIPVSTGGGDNMMGAIGTGNVTAGMVTVSLGTSGTVYAFSDQPVVDPGGNIASFCSSTNGWLPLLCTMNCTVSTELMRKLMAADIDEFEADIAAAPPGCEGLITVPFFNGERTPNLPMAKACLFGMDSNNTRQENLLRSAVEGATFALRFGLEELSRLGVQTEEIVLTGGGANSATWRQLVADISNTPVTLFQNREGAAFGAALQALAMLEGSATSLDAVLDTHLVRNDECCCEPDPTVADRYNESYEKYQRAVESVAVLYR